MKTIISSYKDCLYAFDDKIKSAVSRISPCDSEKITEFRLRSHNPLMVTTTQGNFFLNKDGSLDQNCGNECIILEYNDISDTLSRICGFSIHTYQEQIKQGFVTMKGGNRAGICGNAVRDGESVKSITNFYSINIRIARQVVGAADELSCMFKKNVPSMIICGRPGTGKTTILRDIIRQLSSGAFSSMKRVAVIDERGELAAVHDGVMRFDLGPCCDVLSGVPKSFGINSAVRTLNPQAVVFDEIAAREDGMAVISCAYTGVPVITSIHASNDAELNKRLENIGLSEKAFDYAVFLDGICNITSIKRLNEDYYYKVI